MIVAYKLPNVLNPKALAQKTVAMVSAVKVLVTKTEGASTIASDGTPNMAKRSIGKYNMITHKWEDKPVVA